MTLFISPGMHPYSSALKDTVSVYLTADHLQIKVSVEARSMQKEV